MSTTVNSGSFLGLQGENCSLRNVEGVKRLITDDGFDIIKSTKGVSHRLDTIENFLQNIGSIKLSELLDVDLTGIEDGAILVYNKKENKWKISLD